MVSLKIHRISNNNASHAITPVLHVITPPLAYLAITPLIDISLLTNAYALNITTMMA